MDAMPGSFQTSLIHDVCKQYYPGIMYVGGLITSWGVVVVVGTIIARSHVLGICASCKHNQSVDIGEKLVCTRFKLLKKAY